MRRILKCTDSLPRKSEVARAADVWPCTRLGK